MNFTGTSEFSNQAFFVLVYDARKQLLKSSDKDFSMQFTRGEYTVVVSPCDVDGVCYQTTKSYTVTY